MNQLVFLVGGRGTRLGSLTAENPKPLLTVGGLPFLDYLIDNAARYGFTNILLLAGYLGKEFESRYQAMGRERGLTIDCLIEPEPAGTGGALLHAADRLADKFILCNGDSFFDINLLDLGLIDAGEDWLAKIALRQVEDGSRYGGIARQGERVVAFVERGDSGPALINGGIYLMRRQILDLIGPLPCSLERDVFPQLATQGRLFGRDYKAFFIDIGIPSDFAAAQDLVPAHVLRPAAFLDRDGVLNHDYGYVHRPEDFHWKDGAISAIKALNDAGFLVFVVSNQAGVARGYYDEEQVRLLHRWMSNVLALHGAHIDRYYFCPHHPDGVLPDYAIDCGCRKPQPGMIEQAFREWSIDRRSSLLIGDKPWDIAAAETAGIRGYLWEGDDLSEFVQTTVICQTTVI
ncbi:MAG: D-glycero-beta-D-manno-heptose 1,7-bisphosphate 7-phosphatase [Alphaproteobacteria bacterium]|nr:D-glycero-beta-D-manno-heptose 1,7-bisphosphate 7-phosphatase [Alphaproteobacteria bacterium]